MAICIHYVQLFTLKKGFIGQLSRIANLGESWMESVRKCAVHSQYAGKGTYGCELDLITKYAKKRIIKLQMTVSAIPMDGKKT
jgi:hypothetical protein